MARISLSSTFQKFRLQNLRVFSLTFLSKRTHAIFDYVQKAKIFAQNEEIFNFENNPVLNFIILGMHSYFFHEYARFCGIIWK